jgi:tetratricopeptide (TPR) repeat protein
MGNVALLYSEVGRWAEAIPLLRQSHELRKVALGVDHPETLISQHNLGCAYRDAGQPAEALPLLEGALKLHTAKMGADHHHTLTFAFNLAWLYRDTGRLDEALALFQETLRRQLAKLGADHPHRLMALNHTGTCLLKMKRYGEADTLLRDCLALRERKDPTSWWVGHTKSQLGQSAVVLKRYAEAEPLLLEAHQELSAGKDKMPARYQGYVAEAARALADLYDAWGRNDRAAEWRKKLEVHQKESGIMNQK